MPHFLTLWQDIATAEGQEHNADAPNTQVRYRKLREPPQSPPVQEPPGPQGTAMTQMGCNVANRSEGAPSALSYC